MLRKALALIYGGVCYAAFLAVAVYAAGFIVGVLTPTTLDGVPARPLSHALAIDIGLLGLFAVQHSGMARPAFKRWWTRIVPEWAERSTYVLLSNVLMVALFAYWEPIGGVVWSVAAGGAAYVAIISLYAAGWVVLLYATFLIDHFDLFGLAQSWRRWTGAARRGPQFHTPGMYRFVRHPLYVGWLMIFWAAPVMTSAHLLFALMTTAYILVAIRFEERDLVNVFGERYVEYRRQTPMLIPRIAPGAPRSGAEADHLQG